MKRLLAALGAFSLVLAACSSPPRWEEQAATYALTLEAGALALGVSQDGPAGSWETLTFDLYRDGVRIGEAVSVHGNDLEELLEKLNAGVQE